MNDARATVIDKCFTMAESALVSSWTYGNSNEALFWLNCVLKIIPQNTAAPLGSARAYQYIASQPWWHNEVALAKHAAGKALSMADAITAPSSVLEKRELAS